MIPRTQEGLGGLPKQLKVLHLQCEPRTRIVKIRHGHFANSISRDFFRNLDSRHYKRWLLWQHGPNKRKIRNGNLNLIKGNIIENKDKFC